MNENFAAIKTHALKILARREHSRYELIQKLSSKGFVVSEIEIVLDDLTKRDWQSDARFVEMYIRSRAARDYGPVKIAIELKERGIGEELISKFLDENAAKWYELAKKVYHKKFANQKPVSFTEQQKQQRFLQYKGFTCEQIKGCFK